MYVPERCVLNQENSDRVTEKIVSGRENYCETPENLIYSPENVVNAPDKSENQNKHIKIELFVSKNHKKVISNNLTRT